MVKRFSPWPVTIFIVLLVLAVLFLLPTLGVLLSSVKTTREIALGIFGLPAAYSSATLSRFSPTRPSIGIPSTRCW